MIRVFSLNSLAQSTITHLRHRFQCIQRSKAPESWRHCTWSCLIVLSFYNNLNIHQPWIITVYLVQTTSRVTKMTKDKQIYNEIAFEDFVVHLPNCQIYINGTWDQIKTRGWLIQNSCDLIRRRLSDHYACWRQSMSRAPSRRTLWHSTNVLKNRKDIDIFVVLY